MTEQQNKTSNMRNDYSSSRRRGRTRVMLRGQRGKGEDKIKRGKGRGR
jgi:hypothetical protein